MLLPQFIQKLCIAQLIAVVLTASGCVGQLQNQPGGAQSPGTTYEVHLIDVAEIYERRVPTWRIFDNPKYLMDPLGHFVTKEMIGDCLQDPVMRLPGNIIHVIFTVESPDAINARTLSKVTRFVYDATRIAKPPPTKVVIEFAIRDIPPVEK